MSYPPPTLGATVYRYVPVGPDGQPRAEETHGGIRIQAMPVIGAADDPTLSDVLITCTGPDGSTFRASAVGFGVRIVLQNETGHIIRTQQSALRIGDGHGQTWPMITGTPDAYLAAVLDALRARYAGYTSALEAWEAGVREQAAARLVLPPGYEEDYAAWYDYQVRCLRGRRRDCVSPDVLESMAPAIVLGQLQGQLDGQIAAQRATEQARVDELREQCVQAAGAAATRIPRGQIYTQESFEALRILPRETVTGYIPLLPEFAAEGPDQVVLSLFDLVTETDAAGNPTHRENIDIALQRTAQ